MKKSLLALAAIAAVSGSAFAQSSVTIYGRIDQGFAQQADAVKNREIRAASANRLGFRGVEDLGAGLKAFFQFEHRFDADTGAANAVFWEGKSFVGLRSNFGDFYLGREDNPAYALSQSVADPFGTDTVASNTSIISGRIGTNRYANSVNYRGTFGGFTVGAQIAEQDSSKAQQTGEDRPWSVAASYTGGPITVGVGHENPSDDDARWTTINAAWDFKVVKVIGLYGFGKNGNQSVTNVSSSANTLPSGIPAAAGAGSDRRSYLIGVTAPIGNGELKASYGVLQAESTADVKYKLDKQFGLGYHYALSKRTTVYADYVNERRDFMPATFKKNGFDLGIKHNF